MAQAQLGVDFYKRVEKAQTAMQIANRRLIRARRQAARAARDLAETQNELATLQREMEEHAEQRS